MPINLKVNLEDEEAKKKIEKLTDEWVKTKQQIIEVEKEVEKLTSELDSLSKKYEDISKKLKMPKEAFADSYEIRKANQELSKTLNILDSLYAKANKLGTQLLLALNPPSKALVKASPNNIIPTETIKESANKTAQEFVETTARVISSKPIPVKRFNFGNLGNIFENLKNKFSQIGKNQTSPLYNGLVKIGQHLVNVLPNAVNMFKNALSSVGYVFRNLISGIAGFTSRVAKLATYTFVFNVINMAFRDMREYMSYLVGANSELSSSLAQVRGNLLTAFQPIWETILPYLIKFTQWLAQATAYIATFINTLLGKSEQQSRATAKNTQQQIALSNQSSKALNKQKKSTDKLSDSEKKRRNQLAKFDELNVIKEHKDKTKKPITSPAGGVGAGGVSQPSGVSFDTSNIDTSGIQSFVEKVKNFFLPLQKPFNNLLKSLDRLKGYVLEAFGDFYNLFLKPLATYVVNEALPHFMNSLADMLDKMDFEKVNEGLRELWKALEPLAEDALKGATWIFDNLLKPLAIWTVNEIVPRFLESLKNILEILRPVAETAGEQLIKLWNDFLKPMAEWTGGVITEKLDEFNDVLIKIGDWLKKPKNKIFLEWLSAFLIGLGTVAIGGVLVPALWGLVKATTAWTVSLLANPITWVMLLIAGLVASIVILITHFDDVKKTASEAWNSFKEGVQSAWNAMQNLPFVRYITDMINNIKGIFWGLIDFISGVFTGNWSRAFKGLGNVVIGIFNSAISAINFGLNMIKFMINNVLSGFNVLIRGVNLIPGVSIPEIPKYDTSRNTIGSIPYLASGAVIPPNSPFLAMLGDQRSGTNIEAPLDTIKQAFVEALQENSGYNSNGNYTFVAQLDGRTIFEETVRQNDMYINQAGRSAFVY